MARKKTDGAAAEARRRTASAKRRGAAPQPGTHDVTDGLRTPDPHVSLWNASRSGARAGRGFRYQDVMTALVIVNLWQERDNRGRVIPEGYDDATVDSELGQRHIQMKSRRPSAGQFSVSQLRKDLRSIAEAWQKRRTADLEPSTILILERSVETIDLPTWRLDTRSHNERLATHIRQSWQHDPDDADAFAASVQVLTCDTPREDAIEIISATRDLPAAVSEIVFSALCTEIGRLADLNADQELHRQASLTIHDVDNIVDHILSVVDAELLEEATTLGVLTSVTWSELNLTEATTGRLYPTPHLLVRRDSLINQIVDTAIQSNFALVAGPSGSGKSQAIWAAAREIRAEYRWQELHSLVPTGRSGRDSIALVVARIESLQPSKYAPVGILVDDAGRHDPALLERMLRRVTTLPGVVVILSVREEDRPLVPLLSAVAPIVPSLDDDLAQTLWRKYQERGLTQWAGWREPAEASNGLLLEYVTLLTEGRGLDAVVSSQIQARENDPGRHLELDILRIVSTANQYGVPLRASSVQRLLAAGPSEFSAAARRLINEHLIVQDEGELFRPLHELRSAAIARATNLFGQSETEQLIVQVVDVADIARFLRRCLEQRATIESIVRTSVRRVHTDRNIHTLVAVVSGFRINAFRLRAQEWKQTLDEAGVESGLAVSAFSMSRTQPTNDIDHLWKPEVVTAIARLRAMPTEPDLRAVWTELDGVLVSELLAEAASEESPDSLLTALTALRGIEPAVAEAAALAAGSRLAVWDIEEAANLVEALRLVDPALAASAVEASGGEQSALSRLVIERPWLVSLEREEKAVVGRWVFFDEAVQPDQNKSVVDICRLALALAPSAEIARIQAVDTRGRRAMVGQYPVADKAIPRVNLPHRLEVAENRAQARALSRLYGKGTFTEKVAAEAEGFRLIQLLLEPIASAFLHDNALSAESTLVLLALKEILEATAAPAQEGFAEELPGALGEYPSDGDAVLAIRSFLQTVVPDLVSMPIRERTPQRAASNLKDIVARLRSVVAVDRYRFLASPLVLPELIIELTALQVLASAGSRNDQGLWAKMRASLGGAHSGHAVRLAADRASRLAGELLASEARSLQFALNRDGLEARVLVVPSDTESLAWPPGELIAVVEDGTVDSYFENVNRYADIARSSREYFLRRVWIAKKKRTACYALA
ncbi:hypothetical protein [Curtobacterium sp. MCPF17_031]|uniref:hypothetical protein n=1 Tax=Curtobacterium sp. MCPF17_031 TaxID=2175653 RepID=UPI0011B6E67E|nr:hypothetical protein [Curtobacterium sp. MCPF17_031]